MSRIGDMCIDLSVLFDAGLLEFEELDREMLSYSKLNDLILFGPRIPRYVRQRLSELLRTDNEELRDNHALVSEALVHIDRVDMQLPFLIGDYTDFYSSRQHAYNVGCMFRDPANALLPNWLHLPVGYHGRASSIVVSGTPIRRPNGQYKPAPDAAPVFGATRQLDARAEAAQEGILSPQPHTEVEERQQNQTIRTALESLPDKEKRLLQMFYFEDKSLAEAGAALGLSKSWSSRLHARAIDLLKAALGKTDLGEGRDTSGKRRARR